MFLNFGRNFKDTTPRQVDLTFSQFVKFITEKPRHAGTLNFADYALAGKLERGRDKDSAWFIPTFLTRPERRADAVGSLSGFVCDFDNGQITGRRISEYVGRTGESYVAWTSYSHGVAGLERWRLFIPYASPLAPGDHRVAFDYFNEIFEGNLDPRCATVSQLWYLPGSPTDAPEHTVLSQDTGRYFATGAIHERLPPPIPAPRNAVADVQIGGVSGRLVGALAARTADNDDLTSRGPTSLRDIESALKSLDPQGYGGYTEWLTIGMAIYDGTKGSADGLGLFDNWSQTCPGYAGPDSITEKWISFGGRTGLSRITAATLFKQAQEAGWSPGDSGISQQSPGLAHAAQPTLHPSEQAVHSSTANPSIPRAVLYVPPVVVTAPVAMPVAWRSHPQTFAMQKQIEDESGARSWKTLISGFRILSLDLLRTIDLGGHNAELICENASGQLDASFPVGLAASPTEFKTLLHDRGVVCNNDEFKHFQELLVEWIKKIQAAVQVKASFTHLGWMERDGGLLGFAHGTTAYNTDGTVTTGIKVAAGPGTTIAKHYNPQGDLTRWKSVTQFLSSQGRPELMAILSTAFGSPLMKFSGHSGAVVSIVSTASGVGKSTALSLAQSVWGSPKAAMHSAADTVLSLSSKMGFTKDLPAYWDDIKGERTFEQFATTIYHITQGKEKSRLSSSAELKEVQNWNCLAVVAANDSLIDIVKKYGKGTDAGTARIFEIRLEQRPAMSQSATFFDACSSNYGLAGEIYAAWLATNADAAKRLVETLSASLSTQLEAESEERFWIAACATMLGGAMIAKRLNLVDFDIPALSKFLTTQFRALRTGKTQQMKESDPGPMIADMIYDHQQTTLRIEAMPRKGKPRVTVTRAPKNSEVDVLIADSERVIRVRKAKLGEWCRDKGHTLSTLVEKLSQAGALTERNADPIAGASPYSSGNRTSCYDIDLTALGLQGDFDGTDS